MSILDKIKNWLEGDKNEIGHWRGCSCLSCRANNTRVKFNLKEEQFTIQEKKE